VYGNNLRLFLRDAWRTALVAFLWPCCCLFSFSALQWHLWYAIQPYAWFLFYPTVFLSVLIGRLARGHSCHRHQHLAGLVRFSFQPSSVLPFSRLGRCCRSVVFLASGIGFSFFYEHLYQRSAPGCPKSRRCARFQLLFEQAMDGVMIAGAGGCLYRSQFLPVLDIGVFPGRVAGQKYRACCCRRAIWKKFANWFCD
jgi:hypothetical protein